MKFQCYQRNQEELSDANRPVLAIIEWYGDNEEDIVQLLRRTKRSGKTMQFINDCSYFRYLRSLYDCFFKNNCTQVLFRNNKAIIIDEKKIHTVRPGQCVVKVVDEWKVFVLNHEELNRYYTYLGSIQL